MQKLITHVDDSFEKVVKLIANNSGRLIIIGLGKSGIIGRKIVATLNSTGTLSSFIHASDALHGDLGNIQPDDVVICISKSGNTAEVKALVPFIKNMGKMPNFCIFTNIVRSIDDRSIMCKKNFSLNVIIFL